MLGVRTKPSLYRDFALLSVLILVILCLVSLWIVFKTYENHSQDVMQKLENEAVRIDRALIIEIERSAYLLESIGRQIDVNSTRIDLNLILSLFQNFDQKKFLSNSEFFWVNAEQEIVLSSSRALLDKPIDVSDRDHVKRAITSPWDIHIGQPVQGRVTNRWVIPVAIGLTNDQGEFKGIVGASLDVQALSRKISGVVKDESINFAITNTAFTLLTQIADNTDFFEEHFSLSKLSKIDFDQKPSGAYSLASMFNENVIYAYYERSSQYPYIILVGYDRAASKAGMISLLVPRLAQLATITLFLLLTLWTVRKRIIKPVLTLHEHTTEILKGNPFVHDVGDDPIEIEQLAHEIQKIYDYTQERLRISTELKQKNNELMRIRESAEVANQLKVAFFQQVGSAITRPVKVVQEYVESMCNELFGSLGNAKYGEMANNMHWELEKLLAMLSDIKTIAQAESELLTLNESEVDVGFALKKCTRLLEDRKGTFQSDILPEIEGSIPKLRVDSRRLNQLLLNMLTLAVRESEVDEPIRVKIYSRKDGLSIEIVYKQLLSMPDDEAPASIATLSAQEGSSQLVYALSELIMSMHEGYIQTRSMPENYTKHTLVFPLDRFVQ